jgi:hypothetical protein
MNEKKGIRGPAGEKDGSGRQDRKDLRQEGDTA